MTMFDKDGKRIVPKEVKNPVKKETKKETKGK